MSIIRLSGFAGENRALHPKLLNEAVGVTSLNHKPGRGDLRPLKTGLKVATIPSGRGSIYRVPGTQGDLGYWVSWAGLVHPVLGFEDEAASKKVYYTGDGHPKVFLRDVISATVTDANTVQDHTLGWRPLGIPAPTAPPGVIASSPATTTETVVRNLTTMSNIDGVAVATTSEPHTFEGGESVRLVITETGYDHTHTILGVTSSTAFVVDFVGDFFAVTNVTGTATVVKDTTESGDDVYLSYCFTRVNDWGWESAPSPPTTEIMRPSNGSTLVQDLTLGTGFGVNRVRVYVTQTTSSGGADFYFLGESNGASITHNSSSVLGDTLSTEAWLPAPGIAIGGTSNVTEDNLTNLIALWNGMMAGICGTGIRYCEPYSPYAWPGAYNVIPPNGVPVAHGVFEQNHIVFTDGRPVLITGSSPDSMDQRPLDISQACVAPKSVVSMGHGVVWASGDGLMYLGTGGAKNLTAVLMTREDWQLLVPSTMAGCMQEGMYYCHYNDGTAKAFMIDPLNPTGLYFLSEGRSVTYYDEPLDQLYMLAGTEVQRWDSGTAMTTTFKSKVFHLPKPTQAFACAEVIGDSYPSTFKLYADGALKYTQTVTSSTPFRLPAGYHGQDWQIEVSTTGNIQGVAIAHSMKELSTT